MGILVFFPTSAHAAKTSNVASGNWSAAGSWSPSGVPTSVDTVTIRATDVITVDTTTAIASTTTINGTLQFSTVANSSLTIVGGNVNVNSGGTLTLGTAATPIQPGTTAYLILSSGTYAAQYGLIVSTGGNFVVYGTTKTPSTTATATANSGDGSISVNTPLTGWAVGDLITVDTEAVTITSIAGGTVGFTPTLTLTHTVSAATPVLVNDLSRNAVVRSSGTLTGSAGGNS